METHTMPTTETKIIAEPGSHEMTVIRVFDAPRELVFRCYTEPALISQWWGPRYLSIEVERLDARPGGGWRFINRDAAGHGLAFHGFYHQVAPPEKLVFTLEYEGEPGKVSLDTVSFEGHGDQTQVTDQSVFQSVADRDAMYSPGMEQSVIETMDRLAELLQKEWKQGT